jgi:hypothetical protein
MDCSVRTIANGNETEATVHRLVREPNCALEVDCVLGQELDDSLEEVVLGGTEDEHARRAALAFLVWGCNEVESTWVIAREEVHQVPGGASDRASIAEKDI